MELKNNCELEIPKDKEFIDTPIGYFWFDDDGILNSVGKKKTRTMKMLKGSMKILKERIGNRKVCMISDTSNTSYYTIEMREELARSLSQMVKAIALVPCTETGKLLASIIFMRKTGFPTKIFTDLSEAKEWIKQYC